MTAPLMTTTNLIEGRRKRAVVNTAEVKEVIKAVEERHIGKHELELASRMAMDFLFERALDEPENQSALEMLTGSTESIVSIFFYSGGRCFYPDLVIDKRLVQLPKVMSGYSGVKGN